MKKSYYILIHYGIPMPVYVTGFIIPIATDEKDALAQLIASLEEHDKKFTIEEDSPMKDLVPSKTKEYLWSLNRPTELNERGDFLVKFIEITKPIIAGYWLEEIGQHNHLVNTH